MTITALKPAKLQAPYNSQPSEPLNLRIQKTHSDAFGARYTQTVKVVLSKATKAYSPKGLSDEMLLTLVLESNAQPVGGFCTIPQKGIVHSKTVESHHGLSAFSDRRVSVILCAIEHIQR
ncbi:MAG: hypothetical protein DCF25_11845 [Leptolyngbya foveolarum]|uniref:Uncharacterized protein n=1 Tax=Leptolyngbya foveolarum TaxID=47253 RepID=A0A2W4UCY2_9CYAN|nr:MAG: hypothetical protein DCF25_11845 [Leptolyngbya foveolarum]